MKVVITEDIIRNALNECIDEFMLEEGMINEWGGSAFKKFFNPIKNAAAMYMDWRTNGRWNRKYNIQAKGKGMMVGTYYLKKWLNIHYNRLYDIVYGGMYGNRQVFYMEINDQTISFAHNWKNNTYTLYDRNSGLYYTLKLDNNNVPYDLTVTNSKGEIIGQSRKGNIVPQNNSYEFYFPENNNIAQPVKIYRREDNSTPESYIATYCTPNAFVSYTRNILEDGNFKNTANAYIQYIQSVNKSNMNTRRPDYKSMLNLFTMKGFYNWCSKNNVSIKGSNNNDNDIEDAEYEVLNDRDLEQPSRPSLGRSGSINQQGPYTYSNSTYDAETDNDNLTDADFEN